MKKQELIEFLKNENNEYDKQELIESFSNDVLLELNINDPYSDLQLIGTSEVNVLEYSEKLFDKIIGGVIKVIKSFN